MRVFIAPAADYRCHALRFVVARERHCDGMMRVATLRDAPHLTVLRCTKCGRIASYGEEPAE